MSQPPPGIPPAGAPFGATPYGCPPGPYAQPGMMPPPASSAVIQDQTPKFIGVPANNRIFVDGKAYEVRYVACHALMLV